MKCSAAKATFVQKVEKAGKVAFSGLAASALIASVSQQSKPTTAARKPSSLSVHSRFRCLAHSSSGVVSQQFAIAP